MDKTRQITHEGEIVLGDNVIPCYVLEDGTRVLSGRSMQFALKVVENEDDRSSAKLQDFLSQKSLQSLSYQGKTIGDILPLDCYKGNQKINGYEATALADICDIMLEARNAKKLSHRQQIVADQAEILMRGFARVGIVALVDEATGYQYDRERFELQKILSAYVSDEVLKWQKTFDIEFYRELFRLWDVPFTPPYIRRKPQFIGGLTNKYIYEQLPHGKEVTDVLREKSERREDGSYKYRFHQSLTPEVGRESLKKQIHEVTTLMAVSDTKEQFQKLFEKRFSTSFQLSLFDGLDDNPPIPQSDFNKNLKKALEFSAD